MNSSYLWGDDADWGPRYYFTYYSEFGDRGGVSCIEVVVLVVTFVIAVIANLSIATCVLRYKEMRTPTNFCLVNLAAADLLFALGVPAVAYTRFTQTWTLGAAVCRLLPYSQFVCGFVLLWTLTLISMDRHRCLAVAPYRSALTEPKVFTAALVTWLIGASLFLPTAFWFKPEKINDDIICTLIFPKSDTINVSLCFTIPVILLSCLLPMGLLIYHYQRIFQRILDTKNRWAVSCVAQGIAGDANVRRDSELSIVSTLVPSWASRKLSAVSISGRQGRAGSLSQHEEIRLHKHLRVVRILLLNVAAVVVMWLPITIVMFLIYIDGRRPNEDTNFFLRSHHFFWALVVAQLNTVVNPLLYGVFTENFRSCFAKFWGGKNTDRTGSRERVSGGTGVRKTGRSLEVLQDRLSPRTPNSLWNGSRPPKKSSSCSIGSIIEVPSSEKL